MTVLKIKCIISNSKLFVTQCEVTIEILNIITFYYLMSLNIYFYLLFIINYRIHLQRYYFIKKILI